MNNQAWHEPIAIIGMAARLPGAVDVAQYWANLRDGVESITFPSDEELLAAGVSARALADPDYVKATATAPYLDGFDAEFFGLTPHEARICDPQLRVFLECAHATVEDAGYDVEQLSDVGVFGSAGANRYLDLVRGSEGRDRPGPSTMSMAAWNSADYLAPLVSYKLGLRGPSLGVLTDCSSSLVAVHLAAASLHAGECRLALAGGVDINVALGQGYWWEPGDALSQDGHCRPFDKTATGTVFASGVGVVALKRLSDAVADRDHIRAVIRSSAVNNDGSSREAFTAAAVCGQAEAITRAMTLAGVRPAELTLVEAHASGTVQGDSTEVAALKAAYQQLGATEPGSCALTSVKGNIGHLGHAAGIASLIKVALSLQHETIPGNVGYQDPNPALELADSPFEVPTQPVPWPRQAGRPRLAAVNTAGVGGTNAHVILEEAPASTPSSVPDRPRIVVWSARTAAAADRYRSRLVEHFGAEAAQGNLSFASSVATLQRGRTAYPYRGAVVAADGQEAVTLLRDPESAGHLTSPAPGQHSSIAFLFPGQGTQHVGVAQDLYDRSPAYAQAFDECLELFEAEGVPLRRLWHHSDEAQLNYPEIAQPLIFAVEYSLARAWQAWGITPDAVVGHSLGEITAAAVAGIFTLPDAVQAVTVRSLALQVAPPGGMIAVAAPEDQVRPFLTDEVRIAVINGPLQVIVAGPADEVREVGAAMELAGLSCRQVRTSHASHVPIAAPAVPVLDRALQGLRLSPPVIDFYSAAAGRLATAAEVTDPGFWSRQLVQPVRFAVAMDALTARDGRLVMIEVGPGRALTAVMRQHPTVLEGRHQLLPTLAQRRTDPLAEVRSALAAVAGVWTEGHAVNWAVVEGLAEIERVPVPGYPYERTRHWVDVASLSASAEDGADSSPFSMLSWLEVPREPLPPGTGDGIAVTLLPADPARAGAVTSCLAEAGLRVVPLTPGASYADNGDSFVIREGEPEDLALVFGALRGRGTPPELLVHASTLGRGDPEVADQLAAGFGAGAELVRQAARAAGAGTRPGLLVLTEGSVDVSGNDPQLPGYAALTALVRTVPAEDVVERAKLIDLGAGVAGEDLVAEIRDRGGDRVVALRGQRRWVPVELPLAVKPGPDPSLRQGGVYLITGGTGGLGSVLATALAGTGLQPVLILTGRKGQPNPELLAELDGLGATVEAHACEVTDEAALAELLDDVALRHGPVNGVFHLAGVIGSGMVAFTSEAKAAATLGPKVFGAVALARVLADRPPLDLFVAFSSRAALEGVAGGADYAAANAVLDALVRSGVPAARRSLTIDWPRWRDVGLAVPDDPELGLSLQQGGALLLELLNASTGRQVGVRHFVNGRPTSSVAAARARAVPDSVAPAPAEAPAGAGEAARPVTTEGRLRVLWAGLLGPIDIPHDADFFDLGGNSLSAVELMSRVRAEFGVDLGIVALFDNPTLDGLADQIDRRES